MNSQIEDKYELFKPRFIFEEHNEFIKKEPSIDEELHSYPIIKTVKTEQIEETHNINNNPHFPIEANLNFPFEIQAKCLQTFAPQSAKISKHYTIVTSENDGNFAIPDLKVENEFPIETKPVIVEIEKFEPIENIEIKTIKNEENESDGDGNLWCDHCDFKTKDLPKLVSHTNICYYKIPFAVPTINKVKRVKKGYFACDHCEHQTNKKAHLVVHINAWHTQKKITQRSKRKCVRQKKIHSCYLCDAKFTSKLEKEYHIDAHSRKSMAHYGHAHPRGILKLMPINKRTQQRRNLLTPTADSRSSCNLCTRKFWSEIGLQNHYKCSHNKIAIEFTCNNCGESFPQKSELIAHIKARMCVCVCEEENIVIANTEADVIDTNRHLAKNSGSKYLIGQLAGCPVGYSCDECSYKCKNICTLKKHIKVHAKQRKRSAKKHHSCQFCEFKSLSEYDLNKHMLKDHKHEKPYFCKLCDCKYALMDDLVKHIKSHFLRR